MKWGSGKAPDIAVNHSKPAIEMHAANHPDTHHDEASVWEIARAMGFPDSFILTGTETEQVARIGNAVPPHLAAAVVAANENHHEWRAAA